MSLIQTGILRRQLLNAFLVVFLFVADNQVGLQGGNFLEIEVLGAPDYSGLLPGLCRMNTELRDADHLLPQPQRKQQLRLRRYQRHDAARRKRHGHAPAHLVRDGKRREQGR